MFEIKELTLLINIMSLGASSMHVSTIDSTFEVFMICLWTSFMLDYEEKLIESIFDFIIAYVMRKLQTGGVYDMCLTCEFG